MEVNVHLPLDALKDLALRLLVGEHVTRGASLRSDPKDVQIARHIESTLRIAANDALETATVQEFATSRLNTLRTSSLSLVASPEARAALDDRFSGALAAVSQRMCQSCSSESGHQCDGRDREEDGKQQKDFGFCVSRIKELFNFLEAAVEREYSRAGVKPTSLMLRANVMRDVRAGEHPVTATTSFEDQGSQRASVIDLAICVERMSWDGYSTIPYTILHELICHAYQGSSAKAERTISDVRCQFADGWMDYVAFTFLMDLTDSPSEVRLVLPTVDHAMIADWSRFGTARHLGRYKEAVDIHQYYSGKACAEALERILRTHMKRWPLPPDSAWPRQKLREFSIALNAIRDNGRTAGAFSACFKTLSRLIYESMSGIPDMDRDEALCDAIQNFCLDVVLNMDTALENLVRTLRLLLQRFNYLR